MNAVEHTRTQHMICSYAIDCLNAKKIEIDLDAEALNTTKAALTTALKTEFDPNPVADSRDIKNMDFQIQQQKQWVYGQASKLNRKARRLQNELNRLHKSF